MNGVKILPEVSVIIPAYNVSPYIRQTVISALGQTVREIEVFVIDDGSTDGTTEQLSDFKDPRLTILRQIHSGVSVSRNIGIRMAQANYIAFLDGDDVWLPGKLEKHLAFMDTYRDTDLTFSLCRDIDSTGSSCGLPSPPKKEVISFQELLRENAVHSSSAVVSRKAVLLEAGLFDPEIAGCEDYDMWLRIARLRRNNIRCIREILTLYRRRPLQLSSDWRSMERSWTQMMEKISHIAPHDVRAVAEQARNRMCRYWANLALENEEFLEGLRLLCLGLQAAPGMSLLQLRGWLLAAACLAGIILPRGFYRKLQHTCIRWGRTCFERFAPD